MRAAIADAFANDFAMEYFDIEAAFLLDKLDLNTFMRNNRPDLMAATSKLIMWFFVASATCTSAPYMTFLRPSFKPTCVMSYLTCLL